MVGRHRQASRLATSCAAENCTATERRCVVDAMYVRADHVVPSYSDAVSLCWSATPPPLCLSLVRSAPLSPNLILDPPLPLLCVSCLIYNNQQHLRGLCI